MAQQIFGMAGAAPPAFPFPSAIRPGQTLAGLATDKTIYLSHVSSGHREWLPLAPTPVEAVSAPSLASFNSALFAFVLGTDRKLYYNVQGYHGAWGGWVSFPDGEFQSEPFAVVSQNTLFVFARGTNDAIYYKTLTHVWSNWTEIPGGGRTPSGVNAVPVGSDLHLFVRGVDQLIYTNILGANGQWGGWVEVPGSGGTSAAPRAVVMEGAIFIAVRAIRDNHVYLQSRFPDGRWQGVWTNIGPGTTDHAPTLAVNDRTLTVFVCGQDGRLWSVVRDPASGQWGAYFPIDTPQRWVGAYDFCSV
jgi:hypothetical protein